MHPDWLSNAYLVWDEGTREAYFVDSGAPLEPLLEVVDREGLTVTALLTTHTHPDHVAGDAELQQRFGVSGTREADWAESIPTPGHADDHVTFVAAHPFLVEGAGTAGARRVGILVDAEVVGKNRLAEGVDE